MSNPNAVATPGYGFTSGSSAAAATHPLYPHHSPALASALIATANALVNPRGKGIYATDETPEGIEARLAVYDSKTYNDQEKADRRRKWRECLYSSAPTDYISGVILFSETLTAFNLAPLLIQRGIIPGVRVDLDGQPCPGSPAGSGEVATQGHDDLLARCQAYHAAGARFTKWRAPFLVNESGTLPSPSAIEAQAEGLAKFAAISQMAGLVPIIEPDLAFEGDASLQRSVDAHVKVISAIYAKCAIYGVLLEGTLLKPSFPQPGLKHPSRANIAPADVGLATAAALARSMPITVAGVVFLSGGLSDAQSVQFLDAVNKVRNGIGLPIEAAGFATRLPPLTFSFGRGLQGNAMEQWANGDEKGAQDAFAARAKICSDASKGQLA